MKPTTVISVRKRTPSELLADPGFRYVGRRCAGWTPSEFGNPFKPGMTWRQVAGVFARDGAKFHVCARPDHSGPDLASIIALYEDWLGINPDRWLRVFALKGLTLGCWCVPEPWTPGMPVSRPCHAIVLACLADGVDVPPMSSPPPSRTLLDRDPREPIEGQGNLPFGDAI